MVLECAATVEMKGNGQQNTEEYVEKKKPHRIICRA